VSPTPFIMRKRLKVESMQAGLSEPSNANIPVTPPIGLNSGTLESENQGLMLQRGHGNATPYEKVQNILERHGRSFCDELGVRIMQFNNPIEITLTVVAL